MIILSDLHMGAGDGADDFAGNDSALIAKCKEWKAAKQDVWLVGDIFDLWETHSLRKIEKRHGPAIEALFPLVRGYVAGNHDDRMLGRVYRNVLCANEIVINKTLIIHGHQFDPLVQRWPSLCKRVVRVGAWFERNVHEDADRWAAGLTARLGKTGRHGEEKCYRLLVLKASAKRHCRQAVFGHTHQRDTWQSRYTGAAVYNCGSWINGARDYVKL